MPDTITTEFLALRDRYIASCFTKLNPVQQQAVFTTEGPLLILAGAGSGKTTVLVNRIANIIRFGRAYGSKEVSRPVAQSDLEQLRTAIMCGQPVPQSLMPLMSVAPARPWNVLAITFTNKAAGELKERLRAMLGDTLGGDVNASTFHSACVRMLRRDAERIGFPKSFTIYDSDDQQRVIKQIYKELMIDDKFLPVKSAISQISGYKDKLLSAKDVAAEAPRDTKAALISKIYTAYSNRLRTAGAMDFDDLIFHTVQMLKSDAEAREYYQQKFRYVVVDEYQDTSVAQFHLVRLLAGGSNNVCVVGDDDQSIYKFRGATIENILNFEKVFAGAKTIRLEQNYRSTSNILNAANSVIKNNNGRKGKTLWTQNGDGDKVHHYTAASEQDEASHVAEVIGQNLKNGASLKDHAVLYRMNAQSNPIETYFARAGIPYRIVGGQRFFDRKEVKDHGEGGMFVCADDADAAAAPGIRHNGCCAYPADRERYWSPAMSCVDSFLDDRWPQNFCIGEAQCALGTEELKSVIANNNTLIEQDRKIREKLAGLPEISFSRCPENGRYVVHQYIMHYDGSACGKTRDDLLDLMTKKYGIRCIVQYYPLYRYPLFQRKGCGEFDCPVLDKWWDGSFSFPWWCGMDDTVIDTLCSSLISAVEELRG